MNIKNIAIVGGTHGNEYTGAYLIRKLQSDGIQEQWQDLNIELLVANPKAYEQGVRFIDHDLNRSFAVKDLENFDLSGYEANRAKVISQKIGAGSSTKADLIIDLHTTTTNMGVTLILTSDDEYSFKLAAYIKTQIPYCFIYYIPADSYTSDAEHCFLVSLAPHGFAIEVGPIPNAVIRHDILKQTKQALETALAFVNRVNSGQLPAIPETIEVFKHKKIVEFPKDQEGNRVAIIHEEFQDKDYQALKKGDPIFYTLEDEVISFEENEIYYPVFINEAAYYYKNTAFSLTEKLSVSTQTGLSSQTN